MLKIRDVHAHVNNRTSKPFCHIKDAFIGSQNQREKNIKNVPKIRSMNPRFDAVKKTYQYLIENSGNMWTPLLTGQISYFTVFTAI